MEEVAANPAAGVGMFAALAAGTVSFLSPCVLPLVPGYLSTVTGVAISDLQRGPSWRRVLGPSLLFILSFSAVFIALGATATGFGQALRDNRETLNKVAGVLIIAMGLLFVATMFVNRLNREWHVESLFTRAGKGGPVIVGLAFAVAWTPCVGPTLAAILSAAALSDSVGSGAFLLGVYSAGLGIPFLLTALFFTRMTTAFSVIRRHYRGIMATGGVVLVVMGYLIFTNQLFELNIEAQRFLDRFGLNFFADV